MKNKPALIFNFPPRSFSTGGGVLITGTLAAEFLNVSY